MELDIKICSVKETLVRKLMLFDYTVELTTLFQYITKAFIHVIIISHGKTHRPDLIKLHNPVLFTCVAQMNPELRFFFKPAGMQYAKV